MMPLNFFINEKVNETHLYLRERDGFKEGEEFHDFKYKFSYLDTLQDIYKRV